MKSELEQIVSRLESALKSGPRLELALLFGSAARGRLRPDSDLDVGIVPCDPEMSLSDELAFAGKLSRATGREVDLVRLDRAPALVRWEVAKNHVVLAAEPPETLPRFLAQAALEHAEMQPLLDDARRRLARKLRAGAA